MVNIKERLIKTPTGFFKYTPELEGFRDSILVIFGEKKYILQYCDGDFVYNCKEIEKNLDIIAMEKNKRRKNKYNLIKKESSIYLEVVFTPEDYARAIPIVK